MKLSFVLNTALSQLHAYVNDYNSRCETIIITQVMKEGKTQQREQKVGEIKGNVKATAEWLLKLAYKQWQQIKNIEGAEPVLFSNAKELAKKRTVSERTIRNHISRLHAAGIITERIFHGTYHDFEIVFNKEIIYHNPKWWITNYMLQNAENLVQNEVEKNKKTAQNKDEQCQNLPLIKYPEHKKENTSNNTSNVDMLITYQNKAELVQPSTQSQAQEAGSSLVTSAEKNFTLNKQPDTTPPVAAAPPAAKKSSPSYIVNAINAFWTYAKEKLYKGTVFTEKAEREAKNTIYFALFKGKVGAGTAISTDIALKEYINQLYIRIDLAAKAYSQSHNKYAPFPYDVTQQGKGYFSPYNTTNGFINTEKWYKQRVLKYRKLTVDKLIKTAVYDVENYVNKPNKRTKTKTMVQLIEYHKNKIEKYGGKEATERLLQRLQAINFITQNKF